MMRRRRKGSTNRPHERLKFQKFSKIFPTVIALISLDVDDASQHMHNVICRRLSIIIVNVFMILIDGKDHRVCRHSRVLE